MSGIAQRAMDEFIVSKHKTAVASSAYAVVTCRVDHQASFLLLSIQRISSFRSFSIQNLLELCDCNASKKKKKKNKFTSFGQPTRLITCANNGNT